ncbi:MAG: CapA family protein, partial [Acidimicrobiia bacterium]
MRLRSVPRILIVVLGGILLGLAAYALSTRSAADVITAPPSTPSSSTSSSSITTVAPTTTLQPTTTSTQPPRGSLVIHGVGDVNTDVSYIPALTEHGHEYAWEGLGGLFSDDDLTVINLECAPSDLGAPLTKAFIFRCDTASLPIMAAAGVDVANLGNNHSGDYGKEALVDGRANVAAAGIVPVGAGKDAAEAALPAVVEVNGWKIAVVGLGGIYPSLDWFATADRAGMADGDSIETMVEAVRSADEVADLVVVTVHWGVELDVEPTPEDRRRAEAMIAAGADMIFGHHAHRLQPLEIVDGTPVAWNLG